MANNNLLKAIPSPTHCILDKEWCKKLTTKLTQLTMAMTASPSGKLTLSLFTGKYDTSTMTPVRSRKTGNNRCKRHDTRRCFLKMQEDALPLFSPKENYLLTHTTKGKNKYISQLPESVQRRMRYENMHLLYGLDVEDGIPKVAPYNGPLDFDLVPFTARVRHSGKGEAVHFFLYDDTFVSVWYKLEAATHSLCKFEYLFAPDFSLFTDDERFHLINKLNMFRSRLIAAYWQKCGFKVIPVASWGDANSFSYCFKGLPEHSVIAVCGIGHDHNNAARTLWHLGIAELTKRKKPTRIIVYGGKGDEALQLPVPVKYIPDFINSKLRKL